VSSSQKFAKVQVWLTAPGRGS